MLVGAANESGIRTAFTYPDFADYRARSQVFEALVAYTQRPLTLSKDGRPSGSRE